MQDNIFFLPTRQAPVQPAWTVPNNLPVQLTPFIGRAAELATVCALLQRPEVRLLTLTGTGGVGKTRLALEVANNLLHDFPDGLFFVSLAPITNPDLVFPTIAHTLDLWEDYKSTVGDHQGTPLLKAYLRNRQSLLLLDNFEQVVDAAPLLIELLQDCPDLKILVTSRDVLHLHGEYEYVVPPLAVPNLKQLPGSEELVQYAAVALFMQQAQAVKPDFQLTAENAPAIAEICVRLDGLPLALVLAASRIKLLPPKALLKRLEHRLSVLTGGPSNLPLRQQTLRSTIAWSYDLLSHQEQRLFWRLSIFAGGCTLEAAEAISSTVDNGAIPVLDVAASLLDKSLLQQMEHEGEEPRFLMLETIREFGLECLRTSEEAGAISRAHIAYFLALVQQAEAYLTGTQQRHWLLRLEQETANIIAALEAAFELELHTDFVRGVNAFVSFLYIRGFYFQAEGFLIRAIQLARSLEDTAGQSKALLHLGQLAWKQGEYAQAGEYLQEGLALARQNEQLAQMSDLLHALGPVVMRRGDYSQARTYLQEALELARQIKDADRICDILITLGIATGDQKMYDQAEAYFQEGLVLARQLGNSERTCGLLSKLAVMTGQRGMHNQAEAYLREGLALADQYGHYELRCKLIVNLGWALMKQEKYLQAEKEMREGLIIARQYNLREGMIGLLSNLAEAVSKQNNPIQAEKYLQEALVVAHQAGSKYYQSSLLVDLGNLYLKQQQLDKAAQFAREALEVAPVENLWLLAYCQYNLSRITAAQGNTAEACQLAKESLLILEGMGHYDAAEAREWLNSLLEKSQEKVLPAAGERPQSTYPADLTEREVEVLRLVAQGLTNAQIADQLVVSLHTVNAHVRSIFNKLDVNSRSAATRFAIEHKLT